VRPAVLCAAAFVAAAAVSAASATPVPLPSVLTQLTPVPPFGGPGGSQEVEGGGFRFPVDSDERISVGIDEHGRPFSVRVRQRLRLRRAGDYSFTIGAPVEDVRAAPGSESEPGLREGAILWQGFSPRRKLLAADLILRADAARAALPLRISIERGRGVVRIRLVNATATRTSAFTAHASPADAAAALDAVRRRGSVPTVAPIAVNIAGRAVATQRVVAAPLDVRGEIRFDARALRAATVDGGSRHGDAIAVDVSLGDGLPLSHEIVVRRARGAPRIQLAATPRAPERTLEPPRGATWRAFVRGRNVDGRELVSRAVLAQLASARARQYQAFLSNPDPFGGRAATYRYVTARRTIAAAPQRQRDSGGGFPVALAVAIPLAVVALGGLVVLWAHS
jgi:hypothetical protein